jgi:hypothetical protein
LRHNVAVSDGSESLNSQLYFNTNKGNGQALTDALRLEALSTGIKVQNVNVASIDSILANKEFAWKNCMQSSCNRFFVMKVDVEGFELRALRGSASLFKVAAPPVIMIELAPGTIKGISLLKSLILSAVWQLMVINYILFAFVGFDGSSASKEIVSFLVSHGYRLAVENVIACRHGNCDVYLDSFGDEVLDAAVDLKRCSK